MLPPCLYLALKLVHVAMLLDPPGRSEGPSREDKWGLNTSSPEKTLNFNSLSYLKKMQWVTRVNTSYFMFKVIMYKIGIYARHFFCNSHSMYLDSVKQHEFVWLHCKQTLLWCTSYKLAAQGVLAKLPGLKSWNVLTSRLYSQAREDSKFSLSSLTFSGWM